jgi:peptidoglycan/xylan/chitin deacetylase (PgdA/CDA1 family)
MRLDRLLTLYLFGPLGRWRNPRGLRIPILMYHSISDDRETGHPYYWINTSPVLFARHMQYLHDNGYAVISLSTAVKMINEGSRVQGPGSGLTNQPINVSTNNPSTPTRCVVLTFDDGFKDFHTHAFPVLKRHGFTATVFLPTDYIDGTKPGLRGKQHLTWDQVRELAAAGITFGSHTCSHPRLHDLGREEIERELSASKQAIQIHLRQPVVGSEPIGEPVSVDSFCCPYKFPEQDTGFVATLREALTSSGYSCCLSTRIGTVHSTDDVFALRRIPLNSADDVSFFSAKLSGAYDWLSTLQILAKKLRGKGKAEASLTQQSLPGKIAH